MTNKLLMLIASILLTKASLAAPTEAPQNLQFDITRGVKEVVAVNGHELHYRAFNNIAYVASPVAPAYQQLNVYIPEAYFQQKSVGKYDASNAPIFLPNHVGGYMPALAKAPGFSRDKQPDAMLEALSRGLVVVSPGTRGRTLQGDSGDYIGKAPAAIVDLKAVVRYLKFNNSKMPGDASKIIANGTSAGGALSALLGASGDAPEYQPYLDRIGAAPGSDAIYAVSSYCPITNLENADMAYEWMFHNIHEVSPPKRPGAPNITAPHEQSSRDQMPDRIVGAPVFNIGPLSEEEIKVSVELAEAFPTYLNKLALTANGKLLTLDKNGLGTFADYIKQLLVQSAKKARSSGKNLNDIDWLVMTEETVIVNWDKYIKSTGRLKKAPAFDALDLSSGENSLFGSSQNNSRHFTPWGKAYGLDTGETTPIALLRMMNPMYFIQLQKSNVSPYWRIRHGTADNDTSLAIPAMLALALEKNGKEVNFELPWAQSHGGDYDLTELFDWIEKLP